MGTTETLAEYIVSTDLKDFPAETVEYAKNLILHSICGMLAGSVEPTGKKITRYVSELGGTPEAGVIGSGFRTSVENAVLADGTFAHAAELEDDFFPGASSLITVFPVLLPLADKLKLSGKDVIEAFVVGTEILGRLTFAGDWLVNDRGWCPIPYLGRWGRRQQQQRY